MRKDKRLNYLWLAPFHIKKPDRFTTFGFQNN